MNRGDGGAAFPLELFVARCLGLSLSILLARTRSHKQPNAHLDLVAVDADADAAAVGGRMVVGGPMVNRATATQ